MTIPGNSADEPRLFSLDSDIHNQEFVAQIAFELGYGFEAFLTIHEAERRLRERTPEVLVVNGLLPDGSGIAFLQRVIGAGGERLPKLLFYSSSFRSRENFIALQHMGVDRCLSKPARESVLRTALRELHPRFNPATGEIENGAAA